MINGYDTYSNILLDTNSKYIWINRNNLISCISDLANLIKSNKNEDISKINQNKKSELLFDIYKSIDGLLIDLSETILSVDYIIPFYTDMICSKYLSEHQYNKNLANMYSVMNTAYNQIYDVINRYYNALKYLSVSYKRFNNFLNNSDDELLKRFINDSYTIFIENKSVQNYNFMKDNIMDELSCSIYKQLCKNNNTAYINHNYVLKTYDRIIFNCKNSKVPLSKYTEVYKYVFSIFKSEICKRNNLNNKT